MLVSVYCIDKPGSAEPRQRLLDDHLAHVQTIKDKIMVAGPIMNDSQEESIGSLLVFEVGSTDEARVIMEQDPYFNGDIWADVRVEVFRGVVGHWVGEAH